MSQYPRKLAEFLELLSMTEDRAERIQALIDISGRFEKVPERIAKPPYPDDHLTPACESKAYVWAAERADGTLDYHFAVENPQGLSAMAMAVILKKGLSGVLPEDVLQVPREIVYRIFGNELSMGKSMGLMGMVSMVQKLAREHLESRKRVERPDGNRVKR